MSDNKHEQELIIDANPLNSKSIRAAILNANPHLIVRACMTEISSSIKLNVADLPFYAAAFEILRTSISTSFDEDDQRIYNALLETSKVFTFTTSDADDNEESDPDE